MKYPVYLLNIARRTNQIQMPISIAVLTNALKQKGININVIDAIPVEIDKREEFISKTISDCPAIYGFGIIAGNGHLDETEKYAGILKRKNKSNIIIYGGPLPSAVPELILSRCSCDYLISGEGEISLPYLINSIEKGDFYPDHPGIYYKKDDNVIGKPPVRIKMLDSTSDPDYSMLNVAFYINYLKETGQSFEIMASRGCRGNCSFCFKLCGKGISFRSIDSVINEIETVITKYSLKRFYFVDENFLENKKYFFEFLEEKKRRNLDFTFVGQSRIDCIDEEICSIGSRNGLVCVSVGVESPSQKTLSLINKGYSSHIIKGKIKICRDNGILFRANMIIGFPWDTEEDYISMIDFVHANRLEGNFKLSYLTPLPNTRLYSDAKRDGYIKDDFEYVKSLGDLYWERMVNMTSLSNDVLDYYYRKISEIGQRQVNHPKSEEYTNQIKKLH
jgi:magnesium-protoporphyrin IX monomethyl ester (oxidative) cyclase